MTHNSQSPGAPQAEPHERRDLYENDLTEECDTTPEVREEIAHSIVLDPE